MKEQNYLEFVDPVVLQKVVSMYPQYSPAQHLQMLSNIPPTLLDRQAYQDNLIRESSGVEVRDLEEVARQKKFKNYFSDKKKTEPTVEQKEYLKKYLNTLHNPQPAPIKIKEVKVMDLGEAKREVWEMYKKVLGLSGDKVVVDNHIKTLLHQLTLYFIQHPTSPLNLKKGLFIFGGTGVGKTAIFKTFLKFAESNQLPSKFTSLKIATLIREVMDEKKQDRITHATYSQKLIDDLGEEAGLCSWYDGVNKGVMLVKRILDTRYEKFKASGLITHISSNLNPILDDLGSSEVRRLYGDRLGSRFNEMFNMVCLGGEDKRK